MADEIMVRFNLMITPTQLREIDHDRGREDNPPSRGAAIRELIRLGLEARKNKDSGGRDK